MAGRPSILANTTQPGHATLADGGKHTQRCTAACRFGSGFLALLLCCASLHAAALSTERLQQAAAAIYTTTFKQRPDHLLVWPRGAARPRAGIGLWPWYASVPDTELNSFNRFLSTRQPDANLPTSIRLNHRAPWHNRPHFFRSRRSPETRALQQWLVQHLPEQLTYTLQRLDQALDAMDQLWSRHDTAVVRDNLHRLQRQAANDALWLDYFLLHGSGLPTHGDTPEQAAGLLPVLRDMARFGNAKQAFISQAGKAIKKTAYRNQASDLRHLQTYR